jgi:23S rRNA U2552 (ribose-2'-O)-methylase RlmE/FtsJ
MCEAPGGFIECISDIRTKKNKSFDFISVSIGDQIKYDKFINNDKYFYIDITDLCSMDLIIDNTLAKFPYGLDLITADGGFDIKYFNAQEIVSSKLLLSEIFLALSTQKKNGTFIIKFFDMFTHNSIMYYLILCACYSHVKIIKPLASRNCNSERYLICYSYLGKNDILLNKLRRIIHQFKSIIINDKVLEYTIIFPNFSFGKNNTLEKYFISKILVFNNILLHNQIHSINESIKMSLKKDIYFQNLLIKIFGKNVPIDFVVLYKNILKTRINKCINFLKKYNINISNNLYRLF